VVPDSRITSLTRYGPEGPGPDGTVFLGEAVIGGLTVKFIDSVPVHGFSFTPSLSLYVTCDSEDEVDRLANVLGEGGGVLMPLGEYPFSRRYTWFNDRFGVSWQLSVA
jgi:predicted 3-demethylubiquinone-9 3-methyltransferase (glyoxalase superfamily)